MISTDIHELKAMHALVTVWMELFWRTFLSPKKLFHEYIVPLQMSGNILDITSLETRQLA